MDKQMMTPEELIKNASLSNIEVTDEQTVVFTEIAFAAVDMARMKAEKSPWISVEERLPENKRIVIVKDEMGNKFMAYLHGIHSGFITYGEDAYIETKEITHWCNIPE